MFILDGPIHLLNKEPPQTSAVWVPHCGDAYCLSIDMAIGC